MIYSYKPLGNGKKKIRTNIGSLRLVFMVNLITNHEGNVVVNGMSLFSFISNIFWARPFPLIGCLGNTWARGDFYIKRKTKNEYKFYSTHALCTHMLANTPNVGMCKWEKECKVANSTAGYYESWWVNTNGSMVVSMLFFSIDKSVVLVYCCLPSFKLFLPYS